MASASPILMQINGYPTLVVGLLGFTVDYQGPALIDAIEVSAEDNLGENIPVCLATEGLMPDTRVDGGYPAFDKYSVTLFRVDPSSAGRAPETDNSKYAIPAFHKDYSRCEKEGTFFLLKDPGTGAYYINPYAAPLSAVEALNVNENTAVHDGLCFFALESSSTVMRIRINLFAKHVKEVSNNKYEYDYTPSTSITDDTHYLLSSETFTYSPRMRDENVSVIVRREDEQHLCYNPDWKDDQFDFKLDCPNYVYSTVNKGIVLYDYNESSHKYEEVTTKPITTLDGLRTTVTPNFQIFYSDGHGMTKSGYENQWGDPNTKSGISVLPIFHPDYMNKTSFVPESKTDISDYAVMPWFRSHDDNDSNYGYKFDADFMGNNRYPINNSISYGTLSNHNMLAQTYDQVRAHQDALYQQENEFGLSAEDLAKHEVYVSGNKMLTNLRDLIEAMSGVASFDDWKYVNGLSDDASYGENWLQLAQQHSELQGDIQRVFPRYEANWWMDTYKPTLAERREGTDAHPISQIYDISKEGAPAFTYNLLDLCGVANKWQASKDGRSNLVEDLHILNHQSYWLLVAYALYNQPGKLFSWFRPGIKAVYGGSNVKTLVDGSGVGSISFTAFNGDKKAIDDYLYVNPLTVKVYNVAKDDELFKDRASTDPLQLFTLSTRSANTGHLTINCPGLKVNNLTLGAGSNSLVWSAADTGEDAIKYLYNSPSCGQFSPNGTKSFESTYTTSVQNNTIGGYREPTIVGLVRQDALMVDKQRSHFTGYPNKARTMCTSIGIDIQPESGSQGIGGYWIQSQEEYSRFNPMALMKTRVETGNNMATRIEDESDLEPLTETHTRGISSSVEDYHDSKYYFVSHPRSIPVYSGTLTKGLYYLNIPARGINGAKYTWQIVMSKNPSATDQSQALNTWNTTATTSAGGYAVIYVPADDQYTIGAVPVGLARNFYISQPGLYKVDTSEGADFDTLLGNVEAEMGEIQNPVIFTYNSNWEEYEARNAMYFFPAPPICGTYQEKDKHCYDRTYNFTCLPSDPSRLVVCHYDVEGNISGEVEEWVKDTNCPLRAAIQEYIDSIER